MQITVRRRRKDNAGNYSTATQFSFQFDGTPPTNPVSASELGGAQSGVWTNQPAPAFTWPAGSADSGVAGYNVYWGTSETGTTPSAFVTTPGFTPPLALQTSDEYYLRVQTKDNAGNYAAAWTTLFVYAFESTPPVLDNPTLAVLAGADGLYVDPLNRTVWYGPNSSGGFRVGVQISDSDSGPKSAQFPALFGQPAVIDSGAPFEHEVTVVPSAQAPGTLVVVGTDNAGNSSDSPGFTIAKDSAAPVVGQVLAPAVSGLVIPVGWSGSDPAGGAGQKGYTVQYRQGVGSWTDWLINTTQTQADFAGQNNQTYTFRVQGLDRAGNLSSWLESGQVNVQSVTKYYLFNGQRVAMRSGAGTGSTTTLSFLHSDQLGSVSLVTDRTGVVVSQTRYDPFGGVRWVSGPTTTDIAYTGQRADGFELLDFHARYYSPALHRFLSPDTLVPDPYNPLDWDRYAYVRNDPVNNTDPTGHMVACDKDDWACQTHWDYPVSPPNDDNYTFDTGLSEEQVETLHQVEEIVAPILLEPIDWMQIYESFTQGECSPFMLLGLVPFIPGSFGSKIDDLIGFLPAPKLHKHHIFPKQFKTFFEGVGIDIDQHTIEISEKVHLKGVHGKGGFVGPGNKLLPIEKWNEAWNNFFATNVNPTAKDIYQVAGKLLDDFGLSGLPIVPYK